MKSVTRVKKLNDNANVGDRIKFVRTNKLMSQDDLADKIGRKRPEITMYESGARTPDIYTLRDIAKTFGISADYLLGISDVAVSDIDVIGINGLTGLSEEAINNLIKLKKYHSGYLLSTINYLLEQEQILPKEYYSIIDTDNNENEKNFQNYESLSKAFDKRQSHDYIRLITAIDNYLNFNIDSEDKIYISNNSFKKQNELSTNYYDLASTKEIVATKDIVESVWLNKIETMLKELKERNNTNN